MLETPVFSSAAVAAPHWAAAETGRNILAAGGNAVEAMVGMAATIAVVYPHMNAIGGDAFWIIRAPNGKFQAVEACGFAGERATIDRYRALGYDAVPTRGPHAALTVPGAVGGWALALDLSTMLGGRLPLDLLLGDAIRHAREGYSISASEARREPKELAELLLAPGFREEYLNDKGIVAGGATRRHPKLADTLHQLAHAGLDDFYRGDIGREMAADLEQFGAAITRADLERYKPRLRVPLRMGVDSGAVNNFPPPTQGLASLIILGIFERLGVKRVDSFEHLHGLIEATKIAYAVRDEIITDPARMTADLDLYLSNDWLEKQALRISMARAAPATGRTGEGDTIWMGAIDKDGCAVSMIQSIYWEYGSGVVLPRTGILMQNRGVAFSLDAASLNPLQPGRKPFHTLNPGFAEFKDGRIMSHGTMGGDAQPQILAQTFTRQRLGLSIAEALDRPRFVFGRTWGTQSTNVLVENRMDPDLVRDLARAGHRIEVSPLAYGDGFGHAGMLIKHPKGQVEAGHDPRADGGAMGL